MVESGEPGREAGFEGVEKREVLRCARIEGSQVGREELPDARATSVLLFLFTIHHVDLSLTMLRILDKGK